MVETTDALTLEREMRAAGRVLDILDRWSDRMTGHQTQKRTSPRRRLRIRMQAYVQTPNLCDQTENKPAALLIWSREISQTGMSFIHRGLITAEEIALCIELDSGNVRWLQAIIKRRRQVHDNYYEYGVKFTASMII